MIPIKSEKEIQIMAQAGQILSRILQELKGAIKVGITTKDIDDMALDLMNKEFVLPAFKNYRGFPANICTSINEEIVHGIPSDQCVLKEGDIISLDLGIIFKGYFSDAAITVPVGKIDSRKKKLIEVARQALNRGIKQTKANNHLSDISCAVQRCIESSGFSVVREFVGHGIGLSMHEEPEVPNFGQPHRGPILKKGMVLTIEPMVNMGTWEAEITDNGWTAVTKDRQPSAHFEHTIAITDNGPAVLTI
jgi:methionyl aminopeptidase